MKNILSQVMVGFAMVTILAACGSEPAPAPPAPAPAQTQPQNANPKANPNGQQGGNCPSVCEDYYGNQFYCDANGNPIRGARATYGSQCNW